ncbi:filamentous hemagglutinin N-terminal domain-containing protein [Brasilonema sp. CT11]|nr:filamentous hemagglutinin N-terminal domain-containing protein [Brasilonema sp. CT11]
MNQKHTWLQYSLLCSLILLTSKVAHAQITPDNTLGAESSRLTPNVQIKGAAADSISGGAQRGSNLFHSFTQFNVSNGQRVYFVNPAGIQNILTRVTGKEASNILGTLGVNGSANLFLLNPNGILFGPNAQLDIGGSFVGTSASAFRFGEQGEFSATNPQAPPLLTVNPSALFFNQLNPGAIANQGILTARSGRSLVLAGGDISFNTGIMGVLGGRIELAAIAGTGTVELNPDYSLRIPTDLPRADISLFGTEMFVVAGNGGSIAINARNLDISGNSYIASGIGTGEPRNSQTGDITLNATGTIQIREGSQIANNVFENQSGNSSDIRITADSLLLNDKARLSASVFGQGNAGSVIINARDQVVLDNGAIIFGNVEKTGKGNAGNIRISTGSLSMTNGAGISANIYGQGNTGDILIDARDRVSLDKDVRILNGVQNNAIGTGGKIRFNTRSLSIADSAAIITFTFGQGNVGDILINAREQVSLNTNASIQTFVERGNGGNIVIDTGLLSIVGGAELRTTTFGQGKGGNITIDARDHVSFEGRSSGAFSQVASGATGQGGNIAIATGSLLLDNGAQLGAITFGQGNAGNIIINARDQIALNNRAAIINQVDKSGSGKGGDIHVSTGTLTGTNLGVLQTETFGRGNAGNVVINARDHVEFTGIFNDEQGGAVSLVRPGAVGNSGNVEITTGSLFMRGDGAAVIAGTQGKGNAGNVIINARDRIVLDSGDIQSRVNQNAVGKGGDIFITTSSLEQINGSQIDASTFGDGDAGNITIVATQPITVAGISQETKGSSAIFSTTGDNPAIAGTGPTIVGKGKGGNITITAPQLTVRDGAVIDARTFNDKPGGNINITLDSLQLLNGGQIFSTSESSGSAGTITINAKNKVDIAGSDPTYSSRLSQFPRRVVQISPNSSLSVRSSATGPAGNIIVNTPRLTLDNQGTINAQSNAVDGGDITLNSELLLLRRGGNISATAGLLQDAGNGGNITINSKFIVAVPKENSDITANAFQGRGGNITINTQGVFGIVRASFPPPQSDITASSELGVQGQIFIVIRASDSVKIDGVSPSVPGSYSYISSDTGGSETSRATGNGGNITIETPRFSLSQGGTVSTSSIQSEGNAGSVTIRAKDVELDGFVTVPNVGFSRSGISTQVSLPETDVKGGTLTIDTERLRLSNGARLNTSVIDGRGQAGNLVVRASDSIDISGVGPSNGDGIPLGSGLFAQVQTGGIGSGGSINVETKRLSLSNGGQISAETFAQGNAGNVLINANLIDLRGKSTAILAQSEGSTGNAGDIRLNTQRLNLQDGAYISSSSSGNGSAGNLTIRANDIALGGVNSYLSSAVEEGANGNGGNLNITTDRLTIRDGAGISSRTAGKGRAGDIRIDASDNITLDGGIQSGSSSYISARSTATATKASGDITLNTNTFNLNQGATIRATTDNAFSGGNVTINANTIDLTNGGQILTSTSSSGSGGTIALNADRINLAGVDSTYAQRLAEFGRSTVTNESDTSGLYATTTKDSSGKGGTIGVHARQLNISDRALISVDSQGSAVAGDININANTVRLSDRANIVAETASQDGGNISIKNANLLLLRRNSLISATAAQGGNGGNITINGKFIVAVPKENSDIFANAFQGRGGNITINTQGVFGIVRASFPPPQSDITASSQLGVQGQIFITQPEVERTSGLIELPTQVVDATTQIAQICPRSPNAKPLGEFIITGRGSLQPNPLEPLAGTPNLSELATLDSQNSANVPQTSPSIAVTPTAPAIVEAQGWVKDRDGNITLVAFAPQATPSSRPAATVCPVSK